MRTLIVVVLFIASFGLRAQPDSSLAGTWMVGGNGDLYVERIAGNSGRLIFIVEPQAGYFITNTWAVGMRFPLGFLSNSYRVAAVPFVRYYLPLAGNIRPFVGLSGGREWKNNLDPSTLDVVYKERSWLLGVRAGAAFFIRPNISLDAYLYYAGENTTWEDLKLEATGSLANQRFGLAFGFQIYF